MAEIRKKAGLVVIGSGAAGFGAAVTAMQGGVKDIVVLEKSGFVGGNSRMAGGHLFGADTRSQKRAGVVVDRDAAFRETIRYHHYRRVDPHILRAWIDGTAETFDWMEDIGIPMGPYSIANAPYPFGNFYKVIKHMRSLLLDGGNQVLVNTWATAIRRGEDGEICAVEAENSAGDKLTIETRAAMIATGGFAGNRELLHHYFPDSYDDIYYTDALPLEGDGIELARSAGAAMTDYCTIIKENAYSCDSRLDAPNRGAHQPVSLWVNSRGERFHDESETFLNETTNALVQQPGKIGFALFTDAALDALEKDPMGLSNPPDMPGMEPPDDGEVNGLAMPHFDLRKQIADEHRRGDGWGYVTDSLDDLADWIGAERQVLRKTVETYNGYCANGRDGLFAKPAKFLIPLDKPRYYALKFRPILIDTAGPVIVNDRMEALDDEHHAIPGLYAGGVITTGWQGMDYHLHGAALGYSLTSGHLAGKSIAAYLSK